MKTYFDGIESLNVIIHTYNNSLLVKFRSIAMWYNNAVISFYEMLSVIPFTFHQSIGWGEAVLFEWHLKRILNLHTVMQTYHIYIRWTFQIFLKLYTLYMYFNKTYRSPGKISPDGQWRLNDPLIKILHSRLQWKKCKVTHIGWNTWQAFSFWN